jgi:uncharacterized protein
MRPCSARARGDDRPDSDIDILIDPAPEAPIGVWEYSGLKTYIANLFEGLVDVVSLETLKPYIRPAATAEAVYTF